MGCKLYKITSEQYKLLSSKNNICNKTILNEILLTEADDRLKKVQRTIEREFKGSLDPNATVTSSEYYINNNPNTTWLQYLIFSLRHTFGLMSNADVKYLPLVANLAFSNEVGFEKRDDNGRELRLLGQIVNLIKKDDNLFNQLNKVKDSITFSQVYEQLKPQLESIAMVDSESANKVEMRDDYDIIEITSYAQAHEIGNKSCSSSKLCYTQSEDTWNQYTANGVNKPYVCLKKGWERIPEQPGENNPYDEYGTSMIFVFIGPDGSITTSNCRWNHQITGQYMNGNVDQAFDKATLAQTVGVPFDSVFKPYTRDELHSNGVIMFDEVPELLAQGKDPRDIFDWVSNFYDGFAKVRLNRKYNYLREDGTLLSPNQWFDWVYYFDNGFARVGLNNKWNYLREDGTLLSPNQWFDGVGYFENGFAGVKLNGDWYRIDVNGNLYDYDGNLIESAINSPRRISENKIRDMIKNAINEMLLTEGDDRLKKVQRTIEREFKGSLDPNATVTSSEYYVNNNPNTTWLQYLIFSLRHTFGLMSNADVKYLPLVANLAFSDEVGFEKRNDNGKELRLLGQMVNLIKKDANLFNQLNKVKDSITFSQVYEQLKSQLESIARADSEAANNVETRDDYVIVEITSYEQAHEIGNKSCSESKLCYTQSKYTWNQYTANGVNRPYVCLKKGWEQIPEQPGENNPYDEYGTSMIFVFIDPEGNISTSNCRWNHHTTGQYINGNVDQAFDKATLAQTVGMPFNSVFKPYDREYLHSRGIIILDEIPGLLAQGKDPRDIFDWVSNFDNGFAGVRLNRKYNLLREDGTLLSPNQWFDGVYYFDNGFARVRLNGKYNFIREDGTLLSPNQWFNLVDYFYDGFARVRLNGKYNFLRKDGRLLLDKPVDQWFDNVGNFFNGFAWVKLNNKYNLLREDETLLLDKPVDQWFDNVGVFYDGFARVKLNNKHKWNYLREDGTLLLDKPVDQLFDWGDDFFDGFARVKLNNKWNFLRKDGTLVWDKPVDQWFDNSDDFNNGFAEVKLNNKCNFLREDGTLLSPNLWFDGVDNFDEGFARVKLNNKWNHLRDDGRLLWDKPVDQWFDGIGSFNNGFARVNLNNDLYRIDVNGNLYDYNGNLIEPANIQSQISENKLSNNLYNKINNNMKQISENRIRHIVRQVIMEALEEDYPFEYPDDSNAPHNHNSEVFVNAPFDSPNVDPENTTGDDVSHTLSNPSWWNRHYGFNGYAL